MAIVYNGLSVQDILDIDSATFNKLGLSEMRVVVGRLREAGNKRLREFEKAGISSPATRQVEKSGGAFSTKGKDLNSLRSEFVRAKNFLKSPTGTVKGWERVQKSTIETLKEKDIELTPEQLDTLWKSYEKLKEVSPEVANKGLKYSVLKEISDAIVEGAENPDTIAGKMQSKLDEIYEQMAGLENDGGVSEFFEL